MKLFKLTSIKLLTISFKIECDETIIKQKNKDASN